MPESLNKVAGLDRLPIFPLPLVMLPNELLPLHIFEDHYRTMLDDVSANKELFGITHFDPRDDLIMRPEDGSVGCVAEIRKRETLPDGRSKILTLGLIRYRTTRFVDTEKPYLVAEVEYFEDDEDDPEILEPLTDEVFGLFGRMAQAAFRIGGSRGPTPEIQRTSPEALSFLVTAAIGFSNEKKYELLEMTSTTERLNILSEVLENSVVKLEESAEIQAIARTNGHGRKKIDL